MCLQMDLFPNGNLAETYCDGRDATLPPPSYSERSAFAMVACPNCPARFASTREIEREWMEKHLQRSHGDQRITRFGSSRFLPTPDNSDLRKAS